MNKQSRYGRILLFLLRNWNALVAGISLACVVVFGLIPPLQQYLPVFYFAAANAIVWTLIELKTLIRSQEESIKTYDNMRQARSDIISDIQHAVRRSRAEEPAKIRFIGGRIRSMSDLIREVADDLSSGRVSGHANIVLSSIDPNFIAERLLPGETDPSDQAQRNRRYSQSISSIVTELLERGDFSLGRSSCSIEIVHYRSDPSIYAIAVEGVAVYWGPYTWAAANSDWVGPENGCMRLATSAAGYELIRDWIANRSSLNAADTQLMQERVGENE
ncbi:hypothetical protein [Pseudarthrobacter sp. C4D7]|uniref:hypothetical protein n=1 Tax=Pseudarthrobacter sp. C4D7 TaxID=2735268 RepID=UPI001585204B|nr:hypothetical protein [Pseudarthrobacter sp. C4D7]NUT72763.1 hypothetical protein [Pseudarthrobacter sp. C4D7]